MFTKIVLDYKNNLFPELLQLTDFEDITKGRKGAVLVDNRKVLIPLVRTTTKYVKPAQKFQPIHYDLMEKIRKKTNNKEIEFNNALIELYDNQYCTMGFHSDQALDLEKDSYIGIYSCYENSQIINPRKLVIKNKISEEQVELVMNHNSVILFDFTTNQQHLHKIILDNTSEHNRWLGITFRLSKTFIQHINDVPYFYNTNNILKLANDDEIKNFYFLRNKENQSIEYKYPELTCTISQSDLLPIK